MAAAREEFLAAVRGAAAAAGFGAPDHDDDDGQPNIAGSGKLPLLWSAAGELKGACLTALDSPVAAISKSFEWVPAFPVVSSERRDIPPPRVSHGGWSENGEVETLCFLCANGGGAGKGGGESGGGGGGGGAPLAEGQHAVGLLTLRRGVPESALALAAPVGQEVVDAAVYTGGRVLVLLQPGAGSTGGTGGMTDEVGGGEGGETGGDQPASVVMVDPSELPGASGYVALHHDVVATASPPPPSSALGCVPPSGVAFIPANGEGAGREDGVRYRSLPGLEATPPLAVGPAKGLAAVLVGSRRIVLLDLEEDECDEDESDEED